MSNPNITTYRAVNRGMRHGFKINDGKGFTHDSGPIYNDEQHVQIAIAKFHDQRDKDGKPVRGSNLSTLSDGTWGKKARRRAVDFGVKLD